MFWLRNKKIIFSYALLSGGLDIDCSHLFKFTNTKGNNLCENMAFYCVPPTELFLAILCALTMLSLHFHGVCTALMAC